MKILITGAGGFIGSHLAKKLSKGNEVYGVDLKRPEFVKIAGVRFFLRDLRDFVNVDALIGSIKPDQVYHLAADMGGIGFITQDETQIYTNNTRIDLNVFEACQKHGISNVFYSSSACVYPEFLQMQSGAKLAEGDAYPAFPDTLYGWQKLMSEQWLTHSKIPNVRIARFHNIYGPKGTFEGGREKAPAALCRKVAQAQLMGQGDEITIDVWGNGRQERSFLFINDALDGIITLMNSDYGQPLNIGSDRAVTVLELVETVGRAAKVPVNVKLQLDKPVGVMSRNSDNTLCERVLGWKPKTSLQTGINQTYAWVKDILEKRAR